MKEKKITRVKEGTGNNDEEKRKRGRERQERRESEWEEPCSLPHPRRPITIYSNSQILTRNLNSKGSWWGGDSYARRHQGGREAQVVCIYNETTAVWYETHRHKLLKSWNNLGNVLYRCARLCVNISGDIWKLSPVSYFLYISALFWRSLKRLWRIQCRIASCTWSNSYN